MAQKPFHESIMDIISQTNPRDVVSFVAICSIIEGTRITRGHDEITDALGLLAVSGGHQYIDEYMGAIRALQLGAEKATMTNTT